MTGNIQEDIEKGRNARKSMELSHLRWLNNNPNASNRRKKRANWILTYTVNMEHLDNHDNQFNNV